MKKKTIFLLALSVTLILIASINSAIAYFSTYAEGRGGYLFGLGETDIEESFSSWTKRVKISNSEDGQPVYIRARAFAGDEYSLLYSGDGWTLGGDGYYYYDEILYGGERTPELLVRIENVPYDMIPGDGFNVVVVYESTKVIYDENGVPYADWNIRLEGGPEE